MPQNLPEGRFKWVEETSQFDEDFIKHCNENSDKRYILEVNVQYHDKLHKFQLKEGKLKTFKSL